MFGLIKKDLFLIVKNLSLVYLFTFVVVIPPIIQNPSMLLPTISFLVAVTLATQIASTMVLDEKSKWEKIVTGMPLSDYEVVASKYILAVLFSFFSGIIVGIIGITVTLLIPAISYSFKIILVYAVLCVCIGILYNSIMIPATYKFGSGKSRMVLIAFVTLPTLVIFVLRSMNIHINLDQLQTLSSLQLAMLLISFIILFINISFFISVRIQKKRR